MNFGIFGAIFLVLLVLKLTIRPEYSWLLVSSPLIVAFVLSALMVVFLMFLGD